jgi:hypothetical protein
MSTELRQPEVIQKELREFDLANQSALDWLENNPDDNIVKELVNQYYERKDFLINELEESLSHYRHSYLKYAFKVDKVVSIATISKQLSALSNVINKTASAISKKKNTEIPVFLNTVYQSSFGLMLSMDNDDDLLGGLPVQVFDQFFEIMAGLSCNSENLLNLFLGNEELLRGYRRFFKDVLACSYDLDIKYGSHRGAQEMRELLSQEKLSTYYQRLANYEENISDIESIVGDVCGVDLLHKSMLVVPHSRESAVIKIFFPEDMLEDVKPLLGCEAVIKYEDNSEFEADKNSYLKRKNLIFIKEKDDNEIEDDNEANHDSIE